MRSNKRDRDRESHPGTLNTIYFSKNFVASNSWCQNCILSPSKNNFIEVISGPALNDMKRKISASISFLSEMMLLHFLSTLVADYREYEEFEKKEGMGRIRSSQIQHQQLVI